MRLLKIYIYLFFLLGYPSISWSQNSFYLIIKGLNSSENQYIDSLSYPKNHSTVAQMLLEISAFENNLLKNGYIDYLRISETKTNDSTFLFQYELGKPTKKIHIQMPKDSLVTSLLEINHNQEIIPLATVSNYLNNKVSLLEKKGYALAQLQVIHIQKNDSTLTGILDVRLNTPRKLDDIIFEGYAKFPKGHKKQLLKRFKNQFFTRNNQNQIVSYFEQLSFVKQVKAPETLFTKDSTKLYVFIEKVKSNQFEGFLGFGNNESNSSLQFMGYVDLNLKNSFNSGEQVTIFWKNDANQQTSFSLKAEFPFIFQSNFGIDTGLQFFKQDSTFQNSNRTFQCNYYPNFLHKIGIGIQQNTSVSEGFTFNNGVTASFDAQFYTGNYSFIKRKEDDYLFPILSQINFKFGLGSRNSEINKTNQFFAHLKGDYHFIFHPKQSLYFKNESYYLKSNSYLSNELFRFGGMYSIRGFNENSLQAHALTIFSSEYRYRAASNLYLHSIVDYAYFEDQATATNNRLLGLGIGMGLVTKNGLFRFVLANGTSNNQALQFSNSIIHLQFSSTF